MIKVANGGSKACLSPSLSKVKARNAPDLEQCVREGAGEGGGLKIAPGGNGAVCERKPKEQMVLDGEDSKLALKKVEKKLSSLTGKAILDFGMIKDGDRVLVGLSGGKDSLSLLHVLMLLQKRAPIKFDIGACTVDPQAPEYDPRPLTSYLASIGIPYFYESQGIMQQAACSMEKKSICSFCSRMKRGVLYTVCKREGYSVLALGQHLDDQAESFLMSAFHNGQLRTMKCNYRAKDHDVRVIRPLNYVRETLTRSYALLKRLPVIDENCPGCFEQPKERARVKVLLASQEQMFPDLYGRLLRAMMPLMAAGCADPECPAVRELRGTRKAGEVSVMMMALAGELKSGGGGATVVGGGGKKAGVRRQKVNGGGVVKEEDSRLDEAVQEEVVRGGGSGGHRDWSQGGVMKGGGQGGWAAIAFGFAAGVMIGVGAAGLILRR